MIEKPRVLFGNLMHGTFHAFEGAMPLAGGLPRAVSTDTSAMAANFSITGNTGNMAIAEATVRMFDVDSDHSCAIKLTGLLTSGLSPERIAGMIDNAFDLVVIPMTNALRPEYNLGSLADIIDALETPCVVIGLGLQRELEPRKDILPEGSRRFLDILERKALVWGVRGQETADWLYAVGYRHQKILGCPSLYLYPASFLGIRVPSLSVSVSAITAGHLAVRSGTARKLCSLFRTVASQYVMQDEMAFFVKKGFCGSGLYDDATGQVDSRICRNTFSAVQGVRIPFSGFRYFQTMDAWRLFCSHHTFYLGDRFHGGVVAMQARVPSIIMYEDLRVRELTSFYALPAIDSQTVPERISALDMAETLLGKQAVGHFQAVYSTRLAHFDDVMAGCGLSRGTSRSESGATATILRLHGRRLFDSLMPKSGTRFSHP